MRLTIPAYVLTDVLGGRKGLLDEYGMVGDRFGTAVMNCLAEGWSVVGCDFRGGDIQLGEAPMVELELAPPHEPVFWPRESNSKSN